MLGMWSGALGPTSAKVNARIDHDSDQVRALASTSPSLTNPVYSDFRSATLTDNNRMVSLPIEGLVPGRQYYYAIESNGLLDGERVGRLRTPMSGPYSFTFALSACAKNGSNHPIFETIREHDPLFYLQTGDIHYRNIDLNNRDLFRQAFDSVLSSPRQRALYQAVPIAYMWDDHDYGPNDSDATAPGREAARLTYREYVPHYPLAAGNGDEPIYQAFTIGRARFILTDTRSERTPKEAPDDGAKSMLGDAQKAWFKQELLAANGVYPLIVWVCTSPWIADLPGSGTDNWAGYSTERREIATFIQGNDIRGLVMLNGDVHMLAMDDGRNNTYAGNDLPGFPVMVSAPLDKLNATWLTDNNYSEGQYPGHDQFALMTVTDDGGPHLQVEWSGRDSEDQEIVHLELTAPSTPRLTISPTEVTLIFVQGGHRTLNRQLEISNPIGGLLQWQIVLVDPAGWLQLSALSGEATYDNPSLVGLTADPTGLALGLHRTTLKIEGVPATDSPQFVPVTILVTDKAPIYLPTAIN